MSTQALRLVELIAWLSQRDTHEPVTYARAAARLGVSAKVVRDDLAALFSLTEELKPWLASLSVGVEADGFTIRSRGHFRRPFRLTPDEVLALAIGLAGVPRGPAIATRFMKTLARPHDGAAVDRRFSLGPAPSAHVERVIAATRQARDERRKLTSVYCGASGEPVRRTVQTHQILTSRATWYVYAWCETAAGWRLFRAERFLELAVGEERFQRRADFTPIEEAADLLRAEETIPTVVRFDPSIARWLSERYPHGRHMADGGLEVTLNVADPAWLVREVLQYGDRAEVINPESMREAMRAVVAQ